MALPPTEEADRNPQLGTELVKDPWQSGNTRDKPLSRTREAGDHEDLSLLIPPSQVANCSSRKGGHC